MTQKEIGATPVETARNEHIIGDIRNVKLKDLLLPHVTMLEIQDEYDTSYEDNAHNLAPYKTTYVQERSSVIDPNTRQVVARVAEFGLPNLTNLSFVDAMCEANVGSLVCAAHNAVKAKLMAVGAYKPDMRVDLGVGVNTTILGSKFSLYAVSESYETKETAKDTPSCAAKILGMCAKPDAETFSDIRQSPDVSQMWNWIQKHTLAVLRRAMDNCELSGEDVSAILAVGGPKEDPREDTPLCDSTSSTVESCHGDTKLAELEAACGQERETPQPPAEDAPTPTEETPTQEVSSPADDSGKGCCPDMQHNAHEEKCERESEPGLGTVTIPPMDSSIREPLQLASCGALPGHVVAGGMGTPWGKGEIVADSCDGPGATALKGGSAIGGGSLEDVLKGFERERLALQRADKAYEEAESVVKSLAAQIELAESEEAKMDGVEHLMMFMDQLASKLLLTPEQFFKLLNLAEEIVATSSQAPDLKEVNEEILLPDPSVLMERDPETKDRPGPRLACTVGGKEVLLADVLPTVTMNVDGTKSSPKYDFVGLVLNKMDSEAAAHVRSGADISWGTKVGGLTFVKDYDTHIVFTALRLGLEYTVLDMIDAYPSLMSITDADGRTLMDHCVKPLMPTTKGMTNQADVCIKVLSHIARNTDIHPDEAATISMALAKRAALCGSTHRYTRPLINVMEDITEKSGGWEAFGMEDKEIVSALTDHVNDADGAACAGIILGTLKVPYIPELDLGKMHVQKELNISDTLYKGMATAIRKYLALEKVDIISEWSMAARILNAIQSTK